LGAAIDKSWFSKLEVLEENQISKKITLKPEFPFIGTWISRNYQPALQRAAKAQGFSLEIIGY
jgi:hypothetical protein